MKEIEIVGEVRIINGKNVIGPVRNKFVNAGLKGILSCIISSAVIGTNTKWYLPSSAPLIMLGSDTTTPTSPTMTDLVSKIGVNPSDTSVGVIDGSTDGDWAAVFSAVWDAGTISGTVGEAGLYLKVADKTVFGWMVSGTTTYSPPQVLVSRVSAADGDFSSFVVDESKPLSVEWKVHFKFTQGGK